VLRPGFKLKKQRFGMDDQSFGTNPLKEPE
jgi:hypothetical protein